MLSVSAQEKKRKEKKILTENQDPCESDNRIVGSVWSFDKSTKADDEYAKQYPKLTGPKVDMRLARIDLPTVSLLVVIS